MSLTYFKRYRMELDLRRATGPFGAPRGYRLIAWSGEHLHRHADTKYDCFRGEVDAMVFDCLATREGCLRLMEEIAAKPGFLPAATWLIEHTQVGHKPEFCGTVQGVKVTPKYGGIQNVGVLAEHRGRGVGQALVAAALMGFQQAGLRRAYLEVTAQNESAIRLYERMGFRRVKTLYKSVEPAYSTAGK